MEANKVIQKKLLLRKVSEYFSKNPKAESVVIHTKLMGPGNTSWKVIREGKKYNITEVKTSKEIFIMEAPVSGQVTATDSQVSSPAMQPRNSVQARQANVQQFAQQDIATKIAQLSSGMMLNYDTAINTLAQIVKDKSQDLVQFRRALESGINAAPLDANQKRLVGNILGILTSISNESTLMSSKQIKGKPHLKEADDSKKKDQPEEEKPEEPEVSNPGESSLETGADSQDSDVAMLPKFRTEEQMLLTKSLTGQTIKAADIELKPGGGVLTLDLVGVTSPVKLAWLNNGKVVYNFKGRPYVIKKEE